MKIITDQSALRKPSEPVTNPDQKSQIIQDLIEALPQNALGLSAPQINEFFSIFIARLSTGTYVFVNPSLIFENPKQVFSEESCLSIPGVYWCLNRYEEVKIKGEIFRVEDKKIRPVSDEMCLIYLDAFIVQHEYDHLQGVLIIDHPRVMSLKERVHNRQQDRLKRIQKKRNVDEKNKSKNSTKGKIRKSATYRKSEKIARRKMKRRVEILEQIEANKKQLFDDPS